jgi:hypothetical protein
MHKRKEFEMGNIMTLSIVTLIVIALLVAIDTTRMIRTRKMIKASIDSCYKAIEEKEVN